MKIISSFRDYYDTVSHQYLDKEVIYLRDKREILLNSKKAQDYPETECFGTHYGLKDWDNCEVFVEMFYIGFCGKVYPAVNFKSLNENETLFDFNSLKEYIYENIFGIKNAKKYRFKWRSRDCTSLSDYEDFFNDTEKFTALESKFHELNTPCFLYMHDKNRNTKFIVNPILKEYDFAKIKDPFSAHQEIYQFVFGFLKQPKNPMVEISDKDKIHKHGFDKWSFRQKGPKK